MSEMENGDRAAVDQTTGHAEPGPFVLRTLLGDVPLSAEPGREDIRINCVDYLDRNLYVGTSASELLHFVQIPPEPSDPTGSSVFIQALRLRPAYAEPPGVSPSALPGVQQILLLPRVGKACVLCNWTVTFYSLPELTPVFNNTQVSKCHWVGGVDLNDDGGGAGNDSSGGGGARAGVTVLLSLNRRMQAVRIGDEARVVKNIDFAASTVSVRRDSIACVADARNYALLDVDRQLKIPLMSIWSLDESQHGAILGQAQNIAPPSDGGNGGLLRSASSAQPKNAILAAPKDGQAHSRSTSLGGLISGVGGKRQDKKAAEQAGTPASTSREGSPAPGRTGGQLEVASAAHEHNGADNKQQQPTRNSADQPRTAGTETPTPAPAKTAPVFLKPHIVSPSGEEFLLVTGTSPRDPGLGIFVNLDGDPTRPTVEFGRYPREVVVDGGSTSADLSNSRRSLDNEGDEGYVLASMAKDFDDGVHHGLEIQRWDLNVGEGEPKKFWLELASNDGAHKGDTSAPLGIRSLLETDDILFAEVVTKLCQRRLAVSSGNSGERNGSMLPEGWEEKRQAEEQEFVRRLAKVPSRLAVWSGDRIWWAVRNPLLLQLEAQLDRVIAKGQLTPGDEDAQQAVLALLGSFQGRDARTELEYLTFNYVRQRCGIVLLASFLLSPKTRFAEGGVKLLEKVILESGVDPRAVLALIPAFRPHIAESRRGIWVYGGVKQSVEALAQNKELAQLGKELSALPGAVLQFLRRFLSAWRGRKGLPSVTNEAEVFRTVDTALLLVLLELDRHSPKGLARSGSSFRHELYEFVDHGVDCFDTAVDLLEQYHRLYVLSRLYQGRKMSAEVLATWKRIVEGARDDGGELDDGEQRVREYLAKVSNAALVQEYGIWLARRNPRLGVQVFTDDKGRAPKFEPATAVELLRAEAPDAVKYYLEHLVFGKGNTAYVNELINYYLTVVLDDLRDSADSRAMTLSSYAAYRALQPPKPSYRQFLTDNAPSDDDEVWHSRLRLLQLLGGAHDYDAAAIGERIASVAPETSDSEESDDGDNHDLLVPETIILDGRAGRHENALRLLVHRLGDYDTAVAYCLRGGASTYLATPGLQAAPPPPPPPPPGSSTTTAKAQQPPTRRTQERLFRALLREFLRLAEPDARAEHAAALLDGFGGWFDVAEVLDLLPAGWAVGAAAGYLVGALRRLVQERRESMVQRALSSAENLQVHYELVQRRGERPPRLEAATGGAGGAGSS